MIVILAFVKSSPILEICLDKTGIVKKDFVDLAKNEINIV